MPLFQMPIVLTIKADSLDEAQEAIDDWNEELDDLPAGTEEIDIEPDCEIDDVSGHKTLTLALADDDADVLSGSSSDDDDDDDFRGDVDDLPR